MQRFLFRAQQYADALLAMPGTQSYWRLAEGGGTIFRDVLNRNPCPINGAPSFAKGSALFGDPEDRACGFPGTLTVNGLIAVPTLPSGATARTMIGWINTTAGNTTPQCLISYGAGATRQALGIKINDSTLQPSIGFFTWSSDFNYSKTANDGRWHMLGLTVLASSTTAQMYFDGLPAAAASTLSGNLNTSSTNLYIARDAFDSAHNNGAVSGTIDELSIGNVALTSGQIASLWAIARGQ